MREQERRRETVYFRERERDKSRNYFRERGRESERKKREISIFPLLHNCKMPSMTDVRLTNNG